MSYLYIQDQEAHKRLLLWGSMSEINVDSPHQPLFKRANAILFELGIPDLTLMVNQAFSQVTGYTSEEIRGQTWWENLFSGELRAGAVQFFQTASSGDVSNYELSLTAKNGKIIILEIFTFNQYDEQGNLHKISGFGLDITSRKQLEEALQLSEARYQAIAEDQTELICRWLPDGTLTYANQVYCKFFDKPLEEIIRSNWLSLLSIEDREAVRQQIANLTVDHPEMEFEHRVTAPDGKKHWQHWLNRAIFNNAGRMVEIQAIGQDISERKHAERALVESEERYRLALESVKDYAIYTLDPQGIVTTWNLGASQIKGYTADEIIGQNFSRFYPPEDVANNKPRKALNKAVSEGKYEEEGWRVRKDGSFFWASVVITPIRGEDGRILGFTKVVRDVTSRKRLEDELAELQRRLMDGREAERIQLARELHDGPLQELYAVAFNLQAFNEGLPGEIDQSLVDEVHAGLLKVTRTLRRISGELRPPTLATFGLEKAIRSHAEAFQELYPEFEMQMDLASDGQTLPEYVRLALFRIYQALLNNVIRHSKAKQVQIRLSLDTEQVRLEIQDNGSGFTLPERWINVAREGHLGLASAEERANAIGGRLDIETIPGKGTTVCVSVPRQVEKTSPISSLK